MPSNRFFVGQIHTEGETIEITGADAHKIRNVLRMNSGDTITICDSSATEFAATLDIEGSRVHATLTKKHSGATSMTTLRITVAQCIPKGQKMDFIVEKLTELGVATIVPIISERTIADATPSKIERWNRLTKTAAQQSGRRDIPTIEQPAPLANFLARASNYDCTLIPWELAERTPLRETLPPLLEDINTLVIIVGPEGGFSHAETENARTAGAIAVSLGQRILRTETAALVLVAIVNYLKHL